MVAETATGLRRGLTILFALGDDDAAADGGLSVTQIAKLVGREKSQVSRSLKTLREYGLVDRDPATLNYRLGWRLYGLAARAGEAQLLAQAPRSLRRLVDEAGERAHLSVLENDRALTVLSESPPHAVQAVGWVGRTTPLHCTSAGRALLFDHGREEVEALLTGTSFGGLGPNAPRDVEDLHERIAAARARGYAVVDEEFERGLVAVAAPVRNARGTIVAALNLSAPKFRFGRRLDAAGSVVKAAADELSVLLGWNAEPARETTVAGRSRA